MNAYEGSTIHEAKPYRCTSKNRMLGHGKLSSLVSVSWWVQLHFSGKEKHGDYVTFFSDVLGTPSSIQTQCTMCTGTFSWMCIQHSVGRLRQETKLPSFLQFSCKCFSLSHVNMCEIPQNLLCTLAVSSSHLWQKNVISLRLTKIVDWILLDLATNVYSKLYKSQSGWSVKLITFRLLFQSTWGKWSLILLPPGEK